jgi:hypothetical protein
VGKRIGIYFRGKTYRHNAGTGYNYLWIEVRLRESHELIKVLRDRGFFGREVEGYLIVPEDVLREILGEDLYNKLFELNDDSGDGGSLMAPAPRSVSPGSRRGVSL